MLNVKYGGGVVRFNHTDTATITTLQAPAVTPMTEFMAATASAVIRGVGTVPLHMLLRPFDCVTLLVRPAAVARGDSVTASIVKSLTDIGIVRQNITLLVVPAASDLATVYQPATPHAYFAGMNVRHHDPDGTSIMTLGATAHGTPVQINPLLAGRNRVIFVDTVRADPLLGFTGGPEILLDACSRATQEACLRYSLSSGRPLLQSFAPGASFTALAEELRAVARVIQPLFGVNLICNGRGVPFHVVCGRWEEAWNISCAQALGAVSKPLPGRADIVIASVGGAPTDATFGGSVRGLLTAAGALKPDGTLVFTAECKDTPDTPFQRCMEAFLQGGWDELRNHPTLPVVYFAALLETTAKVPVLMQSKINTQWLSKLGMRGFRTSETLEAAIEWKGKQVCCLPDSLSTLPVPAQ